MNQKLKDSSVLLFVLIALIYFLFPRQTHESRVGSIVKEYKTNCIESNCFCLLTDKKIGRYINWSDEIINYQMEYKGKCNNASKD